VHTDKAYDFSRCRKALRRRGIKSRIFRKGTGFPIGPFELADFIGLDVGLDVISYVHDELGDPYYTPPRILKELVRAGRLGRKTGGGFYEYPEEP
jgi:3-hydroxybutyryl-CoA dehydrogenase